MDFYSTTGGNRKKLRSRGGSYAASSLTHMNRHNNKDAGKAKTETKPKQEKHMKTKQSVTESNSRQPSIACREKYAAMKLPIRSSVIAAILTFVLSITSSSFAGLCLNATT
jgi:hypothetical protein